MRSILGLFAETKDLSANKSINRFKYFDESVFENIPDIKCPHINSKSFKEDLDETIRCNCNPSLNTSFLKGSDKDIESIFKNLCKEYSIDRIDWKLINDIIKDVEIVIDKLKNKHARIRPSSYIPKDLGIEIPDKKSFSYPSGHTTIAYFICDLVSNFVPEIRSDLQTLASLIGQSRLENGVHFPTDVNYGRLVGETLADIFIRENDLGITKNIKKSHFKEFSDFVLGSNRLSPIDAARGISDFLYMTNNIENVNVDYDNCFESAKMLIQGYPTSYITDNDHLRSQINGIVSAFKLGKINNQYKIKQIHNNFEESVLDRGLPGEIRNFDHSSPNGIPYSNPYEINRNIKNLTNLSLNPWDNHIVYQLIHPFCDGNGRSGRIILLSDLNFDFAAANDLIGDNYIRNLTSVMDSNYSKIKKLI